MIDKLTDKSEYPNTLTTPEKQPIRIAPHGSSTMSAHAPTATPPASVAFCICACITCTIS